MKRAEIRVEVTSPLDLTHHRAPIYVQLATLFRRFIVTGQWPLERQIPTHEAIAAQFDVNPATVRKAFALLEAEGLVKRFRRRGTFVVGKPSGGDGIRIPTRWEEALAAWDGLDAETLESRAAKEVPRPFHEGGRPARGYSYARRLYRRSGRVVALEETWLDRAVARNGAAHPLRQLERSKAVRIGRAEETLRFGIADRDVASVLDVPLNAPIAVAHVSVFGRDSVLHFESVAYYRGDAARVAESIRFAGERG
jgi:GntR family transcriptional regulator